jgi:hypothetical protein
VRDNTKSFRDQVTRALCIALQPLESVRAGWEGGSAAFDAVDAYSDIDVNFIVDNECPLEEVYGVAESALSTISAIDIVHSAPPGRYYKLVEGGAFQLVDLCLFREGTHDQPLEVERHGVIRPLFDKGDWLRPKPLNRAALDAKRETRYRELRDWFVVSQSFVRKALLRGRDVEALAAFWSYTLRPLAELLRMRFCPVKWDFGMRYLDRDLPADVYAEFKVLAFVSDVTELKARLDVAEEWGARLLRELSEYGPGLASDRSWPELARAGVSERREIE